MSRVNQWLLQPQVSQRLQERCRVWRTNGTPLFSIWLGTLCLALAWTLLPLENPRWAAIRARHATLFPHINPDRPRPLDAVRYLLQGA